MLHVDDHVLGASSMMMRRIKALCLRQPWATLVAERWKPIETRGWHTNYRGPLLIVASKTKPDWSGVLFGDMADWRRTRDLPALQFGMAIATSRLDDCRVMTAQDEGLAMCRVYPNAYAWPLSHVKKIMPFPVKGQLGLFDVAVPVPLTYIPQGGQCGVCGKIDNWIKDGWACASCVDGAMKGKPWPPLEQRPQIARERYDSW